MLSSIYPENFDADTGRKLLRLKNRFEREGMANRVILDTGRNEQGMPTCVNADCDSILTIEDRYSQCRQCILGGKF